MFSAGLRATPQGWANFPKIIGFSILTLRTIAKRLPEGFSSDDSPRGPLSVKNRVLFFSERTILLGPFRALPSKSLITGVISILLSVTVCDRIAWWAWSAMKDEPC